MLEICLLGCGGVVPSSDRWLTALLVKYNGKMVLIDCGEGTQIPIGLAGWGYKAIDAILFTHYHADHIAGLPGLLLTIGNSGRTEPLLLFGPPPLQKMIEGLRVIAPELPYRLEYVELPADNTADYKVSGIEIKSIPVDHTVACLSYSFYIRRTGVFDAERARGLGIPVRLWNQLQRGEKIEYQSKIYTPDMVLGKERKGLKVSYCTDTRPTEALAGFVKNSDLFICEGMYGEDEKLKKASENKHMLFSEAAGVAVEGAVTELWLTHFSPSLENPELFISNARTVFPNALVGHDLMTKKLNYL